MEIETRIFRGGERIYLAGTIAGEISKEGFYIVWRERYIRVKRRYGYMTRMGKIAGYLSGRLMNYYYYYYFKKRGQLVDHGEMWVRRPDFLIVSDSERRRVPESAIGGEKRKAVYAIHDEHDRLGFRWPISSWRIVLRNYDSKIKGTAGRKSSINLYNSVSWIMNSLRVQECVGKESVDLHLGRESSQLHGVGRDTDLLIEIWGLRQLKGRDLPLPNMIGFI